MKLIVITIILSLGTLVSLRAQTSVDEFNKEADYSKVLALKLYPDCAVADSPLVKLMVKMDTVMQANQSQIYHLSSKPIILAASAACILKIPPHWDAVTEGERKDAFDMITGGVLATHDLKPPVAAQEAPPPQQPFNPGTMNGDAIAGQSPTPPPAAPAGTATRNGYLYFYNDLVNKSGDLMGQKNGPIIYRSGPFGGMTVGQGKAYAQQQWQGLTPDQQMACEQNAATYGPGPDPDAPTETHTYNYQPNGMGGGTITGH